MSQTQTMNCVRCRQPLAAGSSFCVSCGHSNDQAQVERQVNLLGQADQRINQAQWFRGLFQIVGGLFRRF